MRAGTLVLYTDQPGRRGELVDALKQIAPCTVLTAGASTESDDCVGLVTDLDFLHPSPMLGLRTLIADHPELPRVFLMRSMGKRSLSAARGLGARLCLPIDTPPLTVAAALRAQIVADERVEVEARPVRLPSRRERGRGRGGDGGAPAPRRPGSAMIVQAADRAGAVIANLLDAARESGKVDAALVERGLNPILHAVAEGGLSAWLDTVRAWDDATYQHCLLVAGLAATFAIDLGFSEVDRQQLVRAALVHDVGKAKIPLEILNKTGRLDPEERAVMSRHPELGHAILVEAGGFDEAVLSVVRHHHEMLDGSGYPDGLAGEEIGDLVRLVTICDIYAALVERRPYRTPMSSAEAVGILYGMEGKLDMALVRAFERAVSAAA